MSHGDVWAVSPSALSANYFRAAATHGGGALVLLKSDFASAGATNGCGYKVTFTASADNTSSTSYTVVGQIVGQKSGTTREVVAAPTDTTPVPTTKYWARVDSITAAATSNAVTVSIGYAAGLALPRTRIKGVHYLAATTAGSVAVAMAGSSTNTILNIDTPAVAANAWGGEYILIPGNGILVGRSLDSDYGVVTLTTITKATLFCG